MAQRFRKPNKYIPINILEEDEQKQAEDTVNDTHTHTNTHIRRLEISGHRSLCLISRVTGVKGLVMIRSDQITSSQRKKRDESHTELMWTFRNSYLFILSYGKRRPCFSKNKVIFPYAAGAGCSNLHVHILPPPPYNYI